MSMSATEQGLRVADTASSFINVSDSAAEKVKALLESEGDAELALRVAVRPGGCSGFSYEMYFDGEIASDDLKYDIAGVRVVTDPGSAQMLQGAVLDYKDGLQGAGFAITNPNAQRTCGCGQSFS
jgi:iron-sulfur cluster assembly protein/iron-sulfur cluster insertion protein